MNLAFKFRDDEGTRVLPLKNIFSTAIKELFLAEILRGNFLSIKCMFTRKVA